MNPNAGAGLRCSCPAAIAAVIAIGGSKAFWWCARTDCVPILSNEIAALTARVVEVQRDLDTTGDQLAALRSQGRAEYRPDAGKSRS